MPKQKVSVNEVRRLLARRSEINSIPFEDIEWVDDDGRPSKVPKDLVKGFVMIGLCNTDFVSIMDGKTRVSVMKFSKPPKPLLSKRTEQKIREAVQSEDRILAVKMYREVTGAGLYDAKKYVDQLVHEIHGRRP